MMPWGEESSWLDRSHQPPTTEEVVLALVLVVLSLTSLFFFLSSTPHEPYKLFFAAVGLLIALWTFFGEQLGISSEPEGLWPVFALCTVASLTGGVAWRLADVQTMFYWLSLVFGVAILASAFKLIVLRWLFGRP
jgi:hypothetical protein